MKKNILFLCSNMEVGGFQKSLISLLQCFDYTRYSVDLLLLEPTGIFMDLIPQEVHVLPVVIDPEYFWNGKRAVVSMIKKRKWKFAVSRFISCLLWTKDKSIGADYMIKAVPKIEKHYDTAIDYNGQHVLYYMMNKINADRKITYFHSDYKKWAYYMLKDRAYYADVSAIVTVSDECVDSMKEVFSEYADKIYCIENINSEKTVNLFPENSNTFQDGFTGIRLVTVGRVCSGKGIDFALQALHLLLEDGYHVRWYMVGPLTDEKFYLDAVERFGACEELVLLGATINPYDYMRNADIIVHPSRFEGKAVAVEEAKILRKPIVVTNYSTVKNQIIDGETGLVVDMNGKAVYEGIKKLIDSEALRKHIVDCQRTMCHGNTSEVEKIYKLIEG